MKFLSGLFSLLLACLAVILYFLGDVERTMDFAENYYITPHEERAAFADAYRRSWGIDKWSISSGASVCASIAFGAVAFKQPKKRHFETA